MKLAKLVLNQDALKELLGVSKQPTIQITGAEFVDGQTLILYVTDPKLPNLFGSTRTSEIGLDQLRNLGRSLLS